jgi:hypothetical protein
MSSSALADAISLKLAIAHAKRQVPQPEHLSWMALSIIDERNLSTSAGSEGAP